MAADLRFAAARDPSPPYDLTFGDTGGSGSGEAQIIIAGTLPAPTLAAALAALRTLSLGAVLPAPTLACSLDHDNAAFRGIAASAAQPWQQAAAAPCAARSPMQSAQPLPAPAGERWQAGSPLAAGSRATLSSGQPLPGAAASHWQAAAAVRQSGRSMHRDLDPAPARHAAGWQAAHPTPEARAQRWQDRHRRPRPAAAARWQAAAPAVRRQQSTCGMGVAMALPRLAPWGAAMRPLPGRAATVVVVPLPQSPCYTPPPGAAVGLVFSGLADGTPHLVFICRGRAPVATVIIPVRRVYFVQNAVSLMRVDGAIDLPALSLSMAIDADSWTWGWQAELPASAVADVLPASAGDVVELEATLNGAPYRLLVESVQQTRSFGSARIRIAGRGISAVLAEPFSPRQSFAEVADQTAQQLMAGVLTLNGAPLGWDLDWGITDWLVPGGVWAHQGSYMSAVNAIAAAAGAYIQPHPTARTLRVLPRYPVAPWDWGTLTPDLELPADVVAVEGIAWRDLPPYNRAYVSGQMSGVLARATRAGTAGDLAAPLIVDPLITHADAARQRALAVLGQSGRIATVSLALPVLPATGIIEPGTVVRYADGGTLRTGIVRDTRVEARLPSLRQTIEVETHA